MNDLSWMLYLAGTLPNLAQAVAVISLLLSVAFALLFLSYLIDKSDNGSWWEKVEGYRHVWLYFLGIFTLTAFIPDKNTMYAIAASEMGEEIMKTPIANKATKALEAWIEAQIPEQKNEEE